jgi:transposase
MQPPVRVEVDEYAESVARVAAIDVAKASGMVCTRVPDPDKPGRRLTETFEVKATTRALTELGDYLRVRGIERVVLESTSDYWRGFYYVLEAAGLEVWLVNAAQVKNVPGRPKTDKLDAVWLARLNERSMLSPSFVPGEAMRHVRDLARHRADLVADRSRVMQRVEKLLEDALIKVSSVLSELHGQSGRAMLEALIAGERRPRVLAELAKGKARAKRDALTEALDGRFTDHHARVLRLLLDQIDDLTARIGTVVGYLDAAIAAVPVPAASETVVDAETGEIVTVAMCYPTAVEKICALPGGGGDSVRAVIGEIGLDMTVFATAPRLCSWAKRTPRTVQSGRTTGRATTGQGNPYLARALGQMAIGASRTDTYLGAYYRRLITRMPKGKALVALERKILTIIFHLLSDPAATYEDLGPDYYEKRIDKTRRTRTLVHQLQALGHHVTLTPTAA